MHDNKADVQHVSRSHLSKLTFPVEISAVISLFSYPSHTRREKKKCLSITMVLLQQRLHTCENPSRCHIVIGNAHRTTEQISWFSAKRNFSISAFAQHHETGNCVWYRERYHWSWSCPLFHIFEWESQFGALFSNLMLVQKRKALTLSFLPQNFNEKGFMQWFCIDSLLWI